MDEKRQDLINRLKQNPSVWTEIQAELMRPGGQVPSPEAFRRKKIEDMEAAEKRSQHYAQILEEKKARWKKNRYMYQLLKKLVLDGYLGVGHDEILNPYEAEKIIYWGWGIKGDPYPGMCKRCWVINVAPQGIEEFKKRFGNLVPKDLV